MMNIVFTYFQCFVDEKQWRCNFDDTLGYIQQNEIMKKLKIKQHWLFAYAFFELKKSIQNKLYQLDSVISKNKIQRDDIS